MSSPSCSSPVVTARSRIFSRSFHRLGNTLSMPTRRSSSNIGRLHATIVHHSRVLRRVRASSLLGRQHRVPAEISVAHIDDFIISRGRQLRPALRAPGGDRFEGFLSFMRWKARSAPSSPLRSHHAKLEPRRLATLYRLGRRAGRSHRMPRNDALVVGITRFLLVLATYGIRASDVASLKLDDLHWRDSKVVVRDG